MKTKIVILALMTAIVVGLLLLDWRPKTKQTTNEMGQPSQQHVHVLQDKSADEVQPGTQQPNPELKSAQPDDTTKPKQESRQENSPKGRQKAIDGYILMSVMNWCFMVEYQVVVNGDKEHISIPLDNTTVQLRTDGKDITTIILGNKESRYSLADYESGIVLVPNQEDIIIWQNWLNKSKQQYKEFLAEQEEKKKGRRILPPTD